AAFEVFSQRRAQTPLPSQLLCAFVASVHGNNIRKRREASKEPRSDRALRGARLRHFHTCGKDRRARSNRYFRNRRRCRSSVVEHPLGKGEVVSSILTGSTSKMGARQIAPLQNRAEQNAKRRTNTHQIRTICSLHVQGRREIPRHWFSPEIVGGER